MVRQEFSQANAKAEVVLRVLLSPIFIVAGLGHFVRTADMVERLAHAPVGAVLAASFDLEVLVRITGAPLVIGGLMLLFGWKTRWASGLLIVVLVPITLGTHVGSAHSVGPLLKNVALFGGLVFFATVGARHTSLDAKRSE